MEDRRYTYYAFVSHSHRDARWADWIWKALEHYRLPINVRKERRSDLPQRLRPVFLDKADLGVGSLAEGLGDELAASRYLIVLCSPESARPNAEGKHYVDAEVRRFIALGRADRIIPVIIAGTPETAFCPALRERDILAVDATKFPRRRVLNDVVAKMLGLRPDELWRREERRRRRQLLVRLAVGAAAAALLSLAGLYYWDWNREKVLFCRDYADCYGVPQPLGVLARGDLAGRHQSYRLHYRGYDAWLPGRRKALLRTMCCVNAHDAVVTSDSRMPNHDKAARWKFAYDERGRIAEVRHATVSGTDTAIFRYSGENADVIDVLQRGHNGQWGAPATLYEDARGKRRGVRVVRNALGHVIERRLYRHVGGVVAEDADGVSRFCYEVDGMGRITSQTTFGWNGAPKRVNRCDRTLFEYDQDGILHRRTRADGTNVLEVVTYGYDRCGNCVKIRSTDADGRPFIGKHLEIRRQFDEHGNAVVEEWWDADHLHAFAGARRVRSYAYRQGRIVATDTTFYDQNGCLGKCADGFSRLVEKYDDDGNVLEVARYGDDGKLVGTTPSRTTLCVPAIIRREYDPLSLITSEAYFDALGNPTVGDWGCAKWTISGNGASERTRRYYGIDGGPVCCANDPDCAFEELSFDDDGRLASVRLYGVDRRPHRCKCGWHETRLKYDRYGYVAEISYFGTDGRPCKAHGIGDDVAAVVRNKFNEAGQLIERSLYDTDGALMIGEQGWASIRWAYDGKGQLVEVFLFGKDGRPVEPRGGINCHTQYAYDAEGRRTRQRAFKLDGGYLESEYDEHGREIANREFNPDGSPAADKDGIHAILFRRDAQGRETKRGFLDVNGKRVLSEGRYAALETRYDDQGAVCEEIRYGVRGELVNDSHGVCIVRWLFDERHRDAGRSFYDAHTNLVRNTSGVAGVRKAYDAAGNKTEEYSVDESGRAIPDQNGVSIAHEAFDGQGRVVRKTFLDADRRPVLNAEGVAGWTSKYDGDSRNEIERRFLDAAGKPCVGREGRAGWRHAYDDRGRITMELSIDRDGGLCVMADGTAGGIRRYDAKDRPCYESWIGGDGQPCVRKGDLSILGGQVFFRCAAYVYDDVRGLRTEQWTLAKPRGGVGKVSVTTDRSGNTVDVRLLDENGNLARTNLRFSRIASKYNAYGEVVEKTWYDFRDELVPTGCAKVVCAYHRARQGMTVVLNYYDAQGFPALNADGVAYMKQTYDSAYRLVSQEHYDAQHKPCTFRKSLFVKLAIGRDEKGRIVDLFGVRADGRGIWGERGEIARLKVTSFCGDKVKVSCYGPAGDKVNDVETDVEAYNADMRGFDRRYAPLIQ